MRASLQCPSTVLSSLISLAGILEAICFRTQRIRLEPDNPARAYWSLAVRRRGLRQSCGPSRAFSLAFCSSRYDFLSEFIIRDYGRNNNSSTTDAASKFRSSTRFINSSAQLPADSTPIPSSQFGPGRLLLLLPHSPDANRSLSHRRIFWQV